MSDFNDTIIDMFRTNAGQMPSGPFKGRELLLLTTTGAKSGAMRTSPLVYTRDGANFIVIASKGGAPTHPAWYLNLLANPNASIEVGSDVVKVRATPAHGAERRRLYDAQAARYPGFAEYELATTREIPVLVLEPLA